MDAAGMNAGGRERGHLHGHSRVKMISLAAGRDTPVKDECAAKVMRFCGLSSPPFSCALL
jgi:hypothetical protein